MATGQVICMKYALCYLTNTSHRTTLDLLAFLFDAQDDNNASLRFFKDMGFSGADFVDDTRLAPNTPWDVIPNFSFNAYDVIIMRRVEDFFGNGQVRHNDLDLFDHTYRGSYVHTIQLYSVHKMCMVVLLQFFGLGHS